MKDFHRVGVVFVYTRSLLLCFHLKFLHLVFAMLCMLYTFLSPCFFQHFCIAYTSVPYLAYDSKHTRCIPPDHLHVSASPQDTHTQTTSTIANPPNHSPALANMHCNNTPKKKKWWNAIIHFLTPELHQGLTFSRMQRSQEYPMLLFPATEETWM